MRWISEVSGIGWLVYLLATVLIRHLRILGRSAPELARTIRAELRPFALPLMLGTYAPDVITHPGFWHYFWLGWGVLVWWFTRHDKDDDDRWKRRRQRLTEKVAEVGGRLAVVPS